MRTGTSLVLALLTSFVAASALAETQPNLVHYVGHGQADVGLEFQRQDGDRGVVQKQDLARMFGAVNGDGDLPIRCALLSACKTGEVARRLAGEAGAAIGYRHDVADAEAIAFCRGFYQGLVNHMSLAQSVQLGKAQMDCEDNKDASPSLLVACHLRGSADPGSEAAQGLFLEFPQLSLEVGEHGDLARELGGSRLHRW